MTPRSLVLGALVCLLSGAAPVAAGAAKGEVEITVRAGRVVGPLPRTLLPSAFASWAGGKALGRFGRDFSRLGVIRLSVERLVSDSKDLGDYVRRLESLDTIASEVARRGGDVILTVARTPGWLASTPHESVVGNSGWRISEASPPRDLSLWSELIHETVRHFNRRLGLNVLYEFWNEPDSHLFWQGTQEEYFRLYRAFVLGARRADPKARVGGPAATAWDKVRDGAPTGSPPMLRAFIEYASQTPLPELGMVRLPLDFVVWHHYGGGLQADWGPSVRQVRDWLQEFGYPRSTLTVLDEWGLGVTGEWATEREAAYWLAALLGMRKAGIDRQAVAALQDLFVEIGHAGDPPDEPSGSTRARVFGKPVYTAMRLSARLGSQILASTLRDDSTAASESGIDAIATKGNGLVAILIASYTPDPRQVGWRYLADKGYQDPSDFGLTTAELLAYAEGENVSSTKQRWSEKQKQDLEAARALYQAQRALARTSRLIRLRVRDIAFRPVCIERYVVDSATGDGAGAYAKAKARGEGEARAVEAASIAESLQPVEARAVLGRSLVHAFSMESYSVALVLLSKPKGRSGLCL